MRACFIFSIVCLLSLALCQCTTSRFKGGAYQSADRKLTCRLPSHNTAWTMKKESGPGSQAVTWWDDFTGELYKVEILDASMLPSEFLALPKREQMMTNLTIVLNNLRSVSAQSRLISQRYLADIQGGASYGFYNAPGTSPIVTTRGTPNGPYHSSRANVTRAVMSFRSQRHLVIVTHINEHLGAIINPEAPISFVKNEEQSLPKLLAFVRSIQLSD
ncbi:hypothetical protein SAMN02745166_03162 [Prosthecobacter debontii]|uniref:DUF4136 domain-containing protein n=2 Tax=Prosthecobacter debontii TaxID=48467 RepID=A0A1T4YGV8_9BACT|nr:hypothetical protein SAMN02745166_03162 [Prosthecobacter debontii]